VVRERLGVSRWWTESRETGRGGRETPGQAGKIKKQRTLVQDKKASGGGRSGAEQLEVVLCGVVFVGVRRGSPWPESWCSYLGDLAAASNDSG
jgi:hypothetical protein